MAKAKTSTTKAEPVATPVEAPKQKSREEQVLELTEKLSTHIQPYLKAGQVSAAHRIKKAVSTIKQFFNTYKP